VNAKLDAYLGNWMFEDFDLPPIIWSPTTSDYQARQVLEEFVKRNPEWWVELAYDAKTDFPWCAWLRPREEGTKEYTPLASGYPLPLVLCRVVILALTNGEVEDWAWE